MTDTVNTIESTPSVIELSFGWTPHGSFRFVAPNSTVLTSPSAGTKVLLTFTATTRIDNNGDDLSGPLSIIEYRWDFGDGTIGYGNPVTHIYKLPNFQAATKLRVTDSKGRQWFTRQQMYLAQPGLSAVTFTGTLNKAGPAHLAASLDAVGILNKANPSDPTASIGLAGSLVKGLAPAASLDLSGALVKANDSPSPAALGLTGTLVTT